MSKTCTLGDFRRLTELLPDDMPITFVEDIGHADELLAVAFLGIEVSEDRIEINVMIEDMELEEDLD